jgi:peptidoglycan/xylan/chitin deacetylase (PgdA/CDA1 family)
MLNRGVFTLSLDFELIWGTFDLNGLAWYRRSCEVEREQIIDRLLALFVEYELPATWCIVGHLFMQGCAAKHSPAQPNIIQPAHLWCRQDEAAHKASACGSGQCIFCARDLVEKIRACPVPQEIGSHSFSHVIFNDPACTRQIAEGELARCVELAQELGIEMRSFAFPRNQVGHLEALRQYGFSCYRGPEAHEASRLPGALRRLWHLWEVCTAARPPVVTPEYAGQGLWNIPGSMIYFPMHGLRRFLPRSVRVKRAVKGLRSAAQQKRIFHLWFHPTNMADQMEEMFTGLREMLDYAAELRARNQLDFAPMGALIPAPARLPQPLVVGAEPARPAHVAPALS